MMGIGMQISAGTCWAISFAALAFLFFLHARRVRRVALREAGVANREKSVDRIAFEALWYCERYQKAAMFLKEHGKYVVNELPGGLAIKDVPDYHKGKLIYAITEIEYPPALRKNELSYTTSAGSTYDSTEYP